MNHKLLELLSPFFSGVPRAPISKLINCYKNLRVLLSPISDLITVVDYDLQDPPDLIQLHDFYYFQKLLRTSLMVVKI